MLYLKEVIKKDLFLNFLHAFFKLLII
jgi:hypothetical protein